LLELIGTFGALPFFFDFGELHAGQEHFAIFIVAPLDRPGMTQQ
jgi:hypothetical protein